jgi:ankyrin repeat protein
MKQPIYSLLFLFLLPLLGGCDPDLDVVEIQYWGNFDGRSDVDKMSLAIAFRQHALARRLVEERHFDVNAIIDTGSRVHNTRPIHNAVYYNNMEMIHYFVEKGADVNARMTESAYGTPLQTAIWKGYEETALYLLDHGADPSMRLENRCNSAAGSIRFKECVSRGMTPCFYAKSMKMKRVVARIPGCVNEPPWEPSRSTMQHE